ncbi:MAG: HD domain-containing phosphohydrolase [Acidimicrobiales bacterium]
MEILVVDDQEAVRDVLTRILLAAGYRCRTADSVAGAKVELARSAPDLVLCDIDMPGESGLVLVEHLHRSAVDVGVLMVTAYDEPAIAELALDNGALGYLIKPFERNEILINVAAALRRCRESQATRSTLDLLETEITVRTSELQHSLAELGEAAAALDRSHEEALRRLACAAELRDPETARHLERMSRYSAALARVAGLSEDACELLRLASPMHDVGKIGIPDGVLLKEGIFTPEDRAVMERHAVIGHDLLAGSSSPLLQLAAVVALNHHERVDGSGYPNGTPGDDIPVEGRIVAIADVFDALTSQRRYKRALTIDEAREVMERERGAHFDAHLLDLFFDHVDEMEAIRDEWAEVGSTEV